MSETAWVIDDIKRERERQKSSEGWATAHDDLHRAGEMARAAAAYALQSTLGDPMRTFEVDVSGGTQMFKRKFFTVGTINIGYLLWPWEAKWWKPTTPRLQLASEDEGDC